MKNRFSGLGAFRFTGFCTFLLFTAVPNAAFAAEQTGYDWCAPCNVPPCQEARKDAVEKAANICEGTQHSGVKINSCQVTSFRVLWPGAFCTVSCDYDCTGKLGSIDDDGGLTPKGRRRIDTAVEGALNFAEEITKYRDAVHGLECE